MEVHPPEHPIFTWKQFFIHMATVCLGLLIAIGLDQMVEHLHHHNEVHNLEQAAELDNRAILDASTSGEQQVSRQLFLLSHRIVDVRRLLNSREAAARFPRIITEGFNAHSDAAWKTAKTNGIAPLVPESENEILSQVDLDYDQLYVELERQWVPCTKRIAFEKEFAVPGAEDEMDLSHASAADLTQYLEFLREELASDVRLRADYTQLRGVTKTILEGEHDPDKVIAAESRFLTGRQYMEQ